MKKFIQMLAIASIGLGAQAATLEERVEALEYAGYENFFKWSGKLENRYDYATREQNKLNGATSKATGNQSYFHSVLFLDMESKPSDRLTFNGRLSMTKLWNNAAFDGTTQVHADAGNTGNVGGFAGGAPNGSALFGTWSNGRSYGQGQLFVERAYVNYKLMDNLVFTAGRLPTVDGMPSHLSSGEGQQGTYPMLAFSAILDGAALTHNTKVSGGSLATRVIYTPFHYYNYGSATGTQAGSNPTNTKDSAGDRVSTNDPMYSVMFDFNKRTKFAANFNLIYQFVGIKDAFFGAAGTNTNPANGTTVTNTTASTLRVSSKTHSLYAEFSRIMNSPITFAASFSMTDIESKGGLTANNLRACGVAGTTAKCNEDGKRYIVTARYDKPKFGFGYEYINNDVFAFAYNTVNRGPLNIYGTGGSTAHHVFANYNLDQNYRIVFGYQKQNIEDVATNAIFIDGKKDDDIDRDNVYTRFIANF